jgi:hypothetical protein
MTKTEIQILKRVLQQAATDRVVAAAAYQKDNAGLQKDLNRIRRASAIVDAWKHI